MLYMGIEAPNALGGFQLIFTLPPPIFMALGLSTLAGGPAHDEDVIVMVQ